jgi:ubiquitin-protein ligase
MQQAVRHSGCVNVFCLSFACLAAPQVRCIISGPQDTPYEGGLFVFDVYFPHGYPNVPPL